LNRKAKTNSDARKEEIMTWTVTNLVIQIIGGILGAHMSARATSEYSFGALAHTIAGAIGGALSGYFLQTAVVNTNGVLSEPRPFEQVLIHGLTGAAAGGILAMIMGFLKHGLDAHRASRSDAGNLPTVKQTGPVSAFSAIYASVAGDLPKDIGIHNNDRTAAPLISADDPSLADDRAPGSAFTATSGD
jgi:uncharacterized membrane protein YeaQ/YmgE (transglycosylase-associated protein family)